MNPHRLLPALLLSLGLLASLGAAPPPPDGFQLNGDAERGKTVFAKHCALCHGAAGDGKSKMSETLKPRPADFTDRALMEKRSDWELYLAVRDGGPAIGLAKTMFAWKGLLPDQDIRDAVACIRALGR